jgi:hypothetical protein
MELVNNANDRDWYILAICSPQNKRSVFDWWPPEGKGQGNTMLTMPEAWAVKIPRR